MASLPATTRSTSTTVLELIALFVRRVEKRDQLCGAL